MPDLHHWLGEIRMFASAHVPPGWVPCDGRILPVGEHRELFALTGNAFGGDGSSTFGVPDFRGRVPVQAGQGHPFASAGGREKVPLAPEHLPAHTHVLKGSTDDATHQSIARGVPATAGGTGTTSAYAPDELWRGIDPSSVSEAGEGAPHENMARFSCLTFALCTVGTWPTHDWPDPPPPPPSDDPYVGEVRMWALPFEPRGWRRCDGDSLRIQDYNALFSVLRYDFGGQKDRFNLPLIEGAVPIHAGQGPGLTARSVGQQAGANEVTLSAAEMAAHRHPLQVSGDPAVSSSPEGLGFAVGDNIRMYGKREGYAVDLARAAHEPAGGGKAHDNLQPYLAVHFYICTEGVLGAAAAE